MLISLVKSSTPLSRPIQLRLIGPEKELPPTTTGRYLITRTLDKGLTIAPSPSTTQGSRPTLKNGLYILYAPNASIGLEGWNSPAKRVKVLFTKTNDTLRLNPVTASNLSPRVAHKRRTTTTLTPAVTSDHLAELRETIRSLNNEVAFLRKSLPSLTLTLTPEGKLTATYTREHRLS